jgi:hypothetical protein
MSSSNQPANGGETILSNNLEDIQATVLALLAITEPLNNVLLEIISKGRAKSEGEWEVSQSVRDELKRVAIETFVKLCTDKTLSKDEWRRVECRWE